MKAAATPPRTRLLFTDPATGSLEWWLDPRDGKPPPIGHADDIRPLPVDDSIRDVLVLPGEQVLSHWLELPARSDAQALAVARHALEPRVASAVATLHLALVSPAHADGRRQVLLVDAGELDRHLQLARRLGARPRVALPDYLLLPPADGESPRIVALHDRWLVRGADRAFSADAALAAAVLEAGATPEAMPDPRLRATLLDAAATPAANLLHGAFATHQPRAGERRAWRFAAVLGAALLASIPLRLAVDGWVHARAADRLEDETRRLAGQLAAAPGASHAGNLVLATQLFDAVAAQDGVRVERLEWDAPDRIEAELRHPATGELQPLRDGLANAGLVVELGSSLSEATSRVSTITVSGATR